MSMNKYAVIVWTEGSSEEMWSGDDLETAKVIAGFEYIKQILIAEHGLDVNILWRPKLEYASRLKSRITVIENISINQEIGGILPKILVSYGNSDIKIFKRFHPL